MVVITVVFAALLGLAVGSFLNVCIWRMPRPGLFVSKPRRSFCPSCAMPIAGRDNVPLLGWIALGGRCRRCQSPVPLRYLVVEAFTGLLFVLVARRFLLLEEPQWAAGFASAVLVAALVVASWIDLDLRILPDRITVRGMMLAPIVWVAAPELHTRPADGLIAALLHRALARLDGGARILPGQRLEAGPLAVAAVVAVAGALAGLLGARLWWRRRGGAARRPLRDGALAAVLLGSTAGFATLSALLPWTLLEPWVVSFWSGLGGLLAGAGLVFGVGVVGSKVFGKPAMGFGDVKLMGLLGAFVGWAGVLGAFFIACALGSVIGLYLRARHRASYIPFGPFLSLGALAVLLWPGGLARLLAWYLELFG